jgi:hypothetical protein
MRVLRILPVVLLGAAAALAVPLVALAQDIHDPSVSAPAPVDRSLLSSEIVGQWRDEAAQQGLDLRAWETDMNRALATQSDGRLLAARSAASWADASRLLGAQPTPFGTNTFGDEATDLVYFPLAPCRILDTRSGTGTWAGRLAAGSTTAVAHNQNLVAQGGNALGCGVPTDPAAIVATVTAVSPTGAGNLRIYATGTTVPNASAINYTNVPGLNLANTTVIPTGQILGNDFYIQVDGSSTHVVVDVAGYFWKPSALPTAGQAFAHFYGSLQPGRTKGFTSATNPATGTYCLVPSAGVNLAGSPAVVSVDYSASSATTVAHWRSSGIGCNAGELAVYLWNTSTGAAVSGGFTVFVP